MSLAPSPAANSGPPILTERELTLFREALGLPPTASQSAILREWARHYWWNHGNNFKDGDPIEILPREVPHELAKQIWEFYESDYRGLTNRLP